MYDDNYSAYPDDYAMYQMSLAEYTANTFRWMALGLLATFTTAYLSYRTGLIYEVVMRFYPAIFILAIAEIIMVLVLSARLDRISVNTATGLFFAYAILNGFTFTCSRAALTDLGSSVSPINARVRCRFCKGT